MFSRLPRTSAAPPVTIHFEGRAISARQGDSVAGALLAEGVASTRTTYVSGAPRAAYCMMGACFDCLVVIDGIADRQACMTEVAEGMTIERQVRGAEFAS
jgi:predicted molibdopterin-dependent oxidoreductase YjgC